MITFDRKILNATPEERSAAFEWLREVALAGGKDWRKAAIALEEWSRLGNGGAVPVPVGWKIVPLEPTVDMLVAGAEAVIPTASAEDIDLARRAARIAMFRAIVPTPSLEMIAATLATMPPFYRALLAAAPEPIRA